MKKPFFVLLTGILILSIIPQVYAGGGRSDWNPCSFSSTSFMCHKKITPHGTTPLPPPPTCNIDKYHHCSAPIVVCFSVRSILTNAGISFDVITQVLHVLYCS
jgi:hypothetical protein